MSRKNIHFCDLYDTNAFRILVNDIQECYKTLGFIHNKWQHIDNEFDDYIANPKGNGYRSIHTAVHGPENKIIEVQIRTHDMHEQAEHGASSHWSYKEDGNQESQYEAKINRLRELVNWQEEMQGQSTDNKQPIQDLFQDRIYAFTPQGDLQDLPQGATALDFAFHIHTDVGYRCRGTKINGKLCSLTTPLKSGDRVEVITHPDSEPSLDWLNEQAGYLNTHRAKQKVHTWFRHKNFADYVEKGEALFYKLPQAKAIKRDQLLPWVEKYNLKTVDDLFAAMASSDIHPESLLNKICGTETKNKEDTTPKVKPQPKENKIILQGMNDFLCQMARCCQPLAGDNVVGYITQSRGISVHKVGCKNLARSIEKNPDRVIEVSWAPDPEHTYPCQLHITTTDKEDAAKLLNHLINSYTITIISQREQKTRNNTRSFVMTLRIKSTDHLNTLITALQANPHILQAKRLKQ